MATKEYSNILACFKKHQDVFEHKRGGWQGELRFEEKIIQMENKRLDSKLSLIKKDLYMVNTCIPNHDTGQLISKIENMVVHYKINPHLTVQSCYVLELAMSYQGLKDTIDCLATYYRYLEPINPEIINNKGEIEEIITIPNREIYIQKISGDSELKKLMMIAALIQILDIRYIDIRGIEKPEIRLINGKPQCVLIMNDEIMGIIDSTSYKQCGQEMLDVKEYVYKALMSGNPQLTNYIMSGADQKLITEPSNTLDKHSDSKTKPSNIHEQICTSCGNPIPKDRWRCMNCGGIDERELMKT